MEIWKDVKGYEGIYKVSNLGAVIRIGGHVKRKEHLMYIPFKVMSPMDNGKGYLRIKLTINNKEKRVMLHRIIAEAFIDNPNNKKTVNHIDGNKKNNTLSNLEWCTQSENVIHARSIGLRPTTDKQRESSKRLMAIIHEKRKNGVFRG